MTERSFEQARRAVERANRSLEMHKIDASAIGERAIAQALRGMTRDLERSGVAVEIVRRAVKAARGGRGGRPRKSGDPGQSPHPAPVRPKFPSSLTGGAEAPLDP